MTRIRDVEVSVLTGSELFREIRTRLPSKTYTPDTVIVLGCGGIGSWVALQLSLLTRSRIVLVDDDVLEESNFGRIPLPPHFAGKPKAVALGSYIKVLRPDLEVVPIVKRIREPSDVYDLVFSSNITRYTVIVETTDSPLAQRIISEGVASVFKELKELAKDDQDIHPMMLYVMSHYDGWRYSVLAIPYPHDPPNMFGSDNDNGYTITPSIVPVPVYVSSIVASLVLLYPRKPVLKRGDLSEKVLASEV